MDLGLTGQDVAFSLVLVSKRILHRHAHVARKEFHSAGGASPRATGAVNKHANLVGGIENSSILRNRGGRVRSLKNDFAGNARGSRGFRPGIAGHGPES